MTASRAPLAGAAAGSHPGRHPTASRRILRLAAGVSLCLFCSQALGWPIAFLAPVITSLMLGLPVPAPSLRQGIIFVLAFLAPLVLSLGLLPLLFIGRWAGIAMLGLALFYTFYLTARGGPAVIGNFMTIALTLVVTLGSVVPELLPRLLPALTMNMLCGLAFVWIAHALLPEPPAPPDAPTRRAPRPPPPAPAVARHNALRSLAVVLPLTVLFLFSSASSSLTPVMIKVAALGQQASVDDSRSMARSLLVSTFLGGLAAVVAWQLLAIWPSLLLYTLLVGMACLMFGRRIFAGPALHPAAATSSYALLTALVVLGPAVGDSPASSAAGAAFWSRLLLFVGVAIYGSAAVAVFDAFVRRPRPQGRSSRSSRR